MRWSELSDDLRLWSLPGSRTKNNLPHIVPLPAQVRAILADRTRVKGKDHVFGLNVGFQGWSKCRERLEARISRERAECRLRRLLAKGEQPAEEDALPTWHLHDLRRTAATGMAEIGIAPHIVEACLNHISGSKAGVAGVYNRALYAEEKKAALQAWADHVEGIVSEAIA